MFSLVCGWQEESGRTGINGKTHFGGDRERSGKGM